MQITIISNRFGHVHIFKGNLEGQLTDLSSNVLYNNKESDLYLQIDTDIKALMEHLTAKQKKTFNSGFEVVIEDIGYFN